MALYHKPHTATIYTVNTSFSSNVSTTVLRAGAVTTISGQLTKKTPQQVYDLFGLETSAPALWLGDDIDDLKQGDHLQIDGEKWAVVAEPSLRNADTVTQHYVVLLDKVKQ